MEILRSVLKSLGLLLHHEIQSVPCLRLTHRPYSQQFESGGWHFYISSGFPVNADTFPCRQLSSQSLPHYIFLCDWAQNCLNEMLGTGWFKYQRIIIMSCWKKKQSMKDRKKSLSSSLLNSSQIQSNPLLLPLSFFIQDLHVSLWATETSLEK